MTASTLPPPGRLSARLLLAIGCMAYAPPLCATDYFLTIGGGYDPTGNQASLEANVQFFQQVLAEKHRGPRRHDIFFADGHDPAADLEIVAEQPARINAPATDLLASLHRRRGEIEVAYRNHRVNGIAGPLDPALIRADLEALAKVARRGDRLIVYVTAHGSEGPEDDLFDTTIDCWNEREITAREFSTWLTRLPSEVPVVMVMAQCYCGGFAHTIFQDLDEAKGLAPQLRVGFFAQQHDLPAAGCRPDIEHDEEFSSYFWGALAGRSRNGVAIEGCDIDGNGVVSFAEAHAYAVTAGETIDIPLRASEVLLRAYSRLAAEETREAESKPALATMSGPLQGFVDRGGPVAGRTVTQLARTLGFALQDDVSAVLKADEDHRRADRSRSRERGPRQGSGRRELLRQVAEKWPELGDPRRWEKSPLLRPDNQQPLLAELKQLPGWMEYDRRVREREAASLESERQELRDVKHRRLINALEVIVLEQNLPLLATPKIVERYRQMVALEESTLNPGASRR
ncbi:MAG TPA: hypothetical protein VM165_06295 [Planctomycetaceae bacterium]|nr:hypothetical protein [Planctomycetaceae bacterium]